MPKLCEICSVQIPDTYGNLLCDNCYKRIDAENASKKASIAPSGDNITKAGIPPLEGQNTRLLGISDPTYKENPQVEEIDMVSRAHGRFKGTGEVMPLNQRIVYTAIKDWLRNECVLKHIQYPKFIWKAKICDVGSGLGIGANILSQEADYILGIDKNEENVKWASQMFTREKNNIYWSPQVEFMQVDVTNEDREFMKFDVVVCIEVIEHIDNYLPLLSFIKRLSTPKTTIFISSPNRNAPNLQKDKPFNPHHVREFTAKEFKDALLAQFSFVQLLDTELNQIEEDSDKTPIVARCRI